jgi:hypothetical protein
MNNDTTNSDITGLVDSDAAIQPYLDVVKKDGQSMNLSTLRSLILKILADPETFCGFDDFKSHCGCFATPNGGADVMAGTTSASSNNSLCMANTLDLFSYGTLKDYTKRQSESMMDTNGSSYYLPLTDPSLMKLAQLTVMMCIQKACWNGETRISYSVLADALGYVTDDSEIDMSGGGSTTTSRDSLIRKVEDVLIRCIYSRTLKGKLCQKTRGFGWETESLPVVASRDVNPTTQIPLLLATLQNLGQRLDASSAELAQAGQQVTEGLADADRHWKAVQDSHKHAKAEIKNRGGGMSSRLGTGGPGGAQRYDSSGSARSTAVRSSKRSRPGVAFTNESGFRM